MPSRTKRGATRSSTPSRASATSRRRAGVRRSRRNRRAGNPAAAAIAAVSDAVGAASAIGTSLGAAVSVVAVVAEVSDQLVDDPLPGRAPCLVDAGETGRARRIGGGRADAHHVRGCTYGPRLRASAAP